MEMREAVERYCALVENADPEHGDDFIGEIKVSLAELLAAAPRIEVPADVDPDFDNDLPPEDENEIARKLAPLIGERDFYLKIFEPFDDSEPVGMMLTEDLASVWSDLRPGLDLLGGPHEADALFDWSWGYRGHWGKHAVSALYVLVHSSYF
jgi:hypothetical protein